MKMTVLKAAVIAAMAVPTVLTGASAASAGPAFPPGDTIPAPVYVSGSGIGPTAEAAFEAALADAQAQADASGFTNCSVYGDPIVTGGVAPGFPLRYRALVTLACSG